MAEEIERIYVVPLKNKNFKGSNAAPTAMKRVKQFLTRHMKVKPEDIWIDGSLNHAIWSHGKYKMKSKIRVKAVKFEDGIVEVSLPELAFEKSRREILREEKEKKAPILRREEMASEEEGAPGAEDYDIAPTGEGEVKIKKKKPSKKKEEKEPEKKEKAKKEPKRKKAEKKKPAKKEKKEKTEKKSTKKSDKKKKTPKKTQKTKKEKKETKSKTKKKSSSSTKTKKSKGKKSK